MQIVNSNDISVLLVKTTWDISGTLPQILLENLSAGPDLPSVSWWFKAYSPTGTPIHEGSEANPDIVGNWTDFTLNDAWPRPFNQIEWSGAPYSLQVFVKDGDGNIIEGPTQYASICRPQGNTNLSRNTFGLATVDVQVKCSEAGIFFQDTTNHSYKGLDGVIGSSVLRVIYPVDETGTIPDPFVADHFTSVQVPITYSSDNYQFLASSIYDYDMGDYVHIRIKYQSFNPRNGSPAVTIPVLCNIDLCPLVCELDKFIQNLETGNCRDAEEAHQKLVLINSKMALIAIGIKEPLCGLDVPGLIEQVKAIGGFQCNCCNAPTGIIPTSASVIDGYTFQIVPICGDITGTVTRNGNLIQFNLQDKAYIFKMCDSSPAQTTSFQVIPSVSGCTKTYCLQVDVNQFASDLAAAIGSDADLLNVWQALFTNINYGNLNLTVDGGCIFQSSSTCDYSFLFQNVPASVTYALLTSIQVGNVIHSLSYSFNLTNLPGLQTYLNSLGLGSFLVFNQFGNVVVTSNTNPNFIQSVTYKVSGTTYIADLSRNCTGYVPISANQVIQNIINYVCGIDDAEVVTSADYIICYIDPADGLTKQETVSSGAALTIFIESLLARGCDTIEHIQSLQSPDCDGMKALFPSSVALMQASDYFFGVKGGNCARILPTEAFLQMLRLGAYDVDVITAFCQMLGLCRGGQVCTPYSNFGVQTVDYDQDCVPLVKYGITSTNPITVGSVVFANLPNSAQSIIVEYKLVSDVSWTFGGGSDTDTGSIIGTLLEPVILGSLTPGAFYNIRAYNTCQSPPQYITNNGATFQAGV